MRLLCGFLQFSISLALIKQLSFSLYFRRKTTFFKKFNISFQYSVGSFSYFEVSEWGMMIKIITFDNCFLQFYVIVESLEEEEDFFGVIYIF